jgi:hypothetical protein
MRRPATARLLAFVVLGFGCTIESDTAPQRPSGLPSAAAWIGGSDGGVSLRLTPQSDPTRYEATVYYLARIIHE